MQLRLTETTDLSATLELLSLTSRASRAFVTEFFWGGLFLQILAGKKRIVQKYWHDIFLIPLWFGGFRFNARLSHAIRRRVVRKPLTPGSSYRPEIVLLPKPIGINDGKNIDCVGEIGGHRYDEPKPLEVLEQETTQNTRAEQIVDIEDFKPNERTATAEADLQRRDRRMTFIYLAVFCSVTLVLLHFWLDRTAGERACRRWIESGEPALEAITIKLDVRWGSREVTCDDQEAIRYFESCLSADGFQVAGGNGDFVYPVKCTVVLRFADEREYRVPGPCEISAKELTFSLPGPNRFSERNGSFRGPLPDGWKHALNTLLGPGTVE